MKIVDILKRAEKAQKTVIMVKNGTKATYGYAVRFMGDPMLQIMEIDSEYENYGSTVTIGKERYGINDSFKIPSEHVAKLVRAIYKLKKIEL